jgi:hypothetical protein
MLNMPEQLDQFSRDEQVQRAVRRALQDGELVPTVANLQLPTSTGSTDSCMTLVPYAAGEGQVSLCVQLHNAPAIGSALSVEGFKPMHSCTSRAVDAGPPFQGGRHLPAAGPLASAAPQPEAEPALLRCKKDQATETSISWERDGFVCKNCVSARPPRPHAAPRPVPASSVRSGGSSRSRGGVRKAPSSNQSRGQAMSSAASTESWESRPGVFSAEPLISHFAPTSALSATVSLLCVMVHWNLPRLTGYCCPFHMAVSTAKLLLRRVDKQHCNPLWSPLTGWQCSHCTCMNRDGKEVCEQCGSQNEAFLGPTAASVTTELPHAQAVPMAQVVGEPTLSSRAALEAYLQQAIGSACSSALDSAALDGSDWPSEGQLPQGTLGKASL